MTPGPTIIRQCSSCGNLLAEWTLNSGNTFGATFWTDAKSEAPMLPDKPWLIKCPYCDALIWLDEQKQVGQKSWGDPEEGKFEDAPSFDVPSFSDYLALLSTGIADPKKVRYLRLRAWWAGNDARRTGQADTPLSQEERGNLQSFAALMDESVENDRLMKAEILRECGEFDAAMSLLNQQFSEAMTQAVDSIRTLTSKRIPHVQPLQLD